MPASACAPDRPKPPSGATRGSGRPLERALKDAPTWALGGAFAGALAGAYLLISPPSADLAAATYRSGLFERAGFAFWDNGWYAGHALPAYSLLAPALGAWLGARTLLALSAVAATVLFGMIAARTLQAGAAIAATLTFAFGVCAELPSGRVPYDLGIAIAIACAAAMSFTSRPASGATSAPASAPAPDAARTKWRRRSAFAGAIALAAMAAAASPVAGSFLALAAVALALGTGQQRWMVVCAAALLPILALSLAFPEGGHEPFAAGAFWPEVGAAIAFAALLPQGGLSAQAWRTLRIAACIYALALAGSFLVQTPMGGNAVRLGAILGAPLAVAVLWQTRAISLGGRALAGRLVLLMLMPLLLYWQLATAIDDQVALAGDPTVRASFYAPVRAELLRLAHRRPIRVEVPLTGAHWESVYLPGGPISIARGWERQLDTRYGALFYAQEVGAAAYRRWLSTNAISYVALPQARLDSAGRQERRLIVSGLPYLREVWHSSRWRLFAVRDATPLAQAPAQMLQIGPDSFTLRVPRPGDYEVRLHWTPYWSLRTGHGCVAKAPGGFTELQASRSGRIEVALAFSLSRVFAQGPRCKA